MRIAMLTNNYKPYVGGVPISIDRLANSLRRLGHEVYIFAPMYEGVKEEDYVIRYKSFKKKLAGSFANPNIFDQTIYQVFARIKFDVIHVHHPFIIGNVAKHLAKKYRLPLILTYHTRYEKYLNSFITFNKFSSLTRHKFDGWFEKKLLPFYIRRYTKWCDYVIAPSNSIREYLLDIGIKTLIETVPTGLVALNYNVDENLVSLIRQKHKQSGYLFLTVSRLAREKNLFFLIDSLNLLKQDLDFTLLIVGEGPIKNELEAYIKTVGLTKKVKLVGEVPNSKLSAYYKAADLFLFTSKTETQGIVFLESFAVGTPAVALYASGSKDIIVNGVNGYLAKDNIKDFSEKIKLLIKDDIKFYAQNAFKTGAFYTSDKLASIVANLYCKATLKERGKIHETNKKLFKMS